MKKILWLASWYPSKVDPYTGDFIERHAQAAARENDIHVLHVVKDTRAIFAEKRIEEHRHYAQGGEATIIYYKTPTYNIKWFEKLYSNYVYLKLHENYLKKYIGKAGKPDGIHVHIGMKAGLAALLLKWKYRIPYVVSEQWSGLCSESNPNFNDKPFMFRWLWKLLMKKATGYSAVSEYLANAMQNQFFLKRRVQVIPNVVNTDVFYPSGTTNNKIQFIHISSLNYQKNAEQILEAAAILKKQFPEFTLLIFGEPKENLLTFTRELNIQDVVEFKGTGPQEELRKFIQQSVALILYSRFETFGCVIIEANACGKPVIVSDIPVFHENVKSSVTGVFVPLNNPALLAETMYSLATNQLVFDDAIIEKQAKDKYSYEIVGKQFDEFYHNNFD